MPIDEDGKLASLGPDYAGFATVATRRGAWNQDLVQLERSLKAYQPTLFADDQVRQQ